MKSKTKLNMHKYILEQTQISQSLKKKKKKKKANSNLPRPLMLMLLLLLLWLWWVSKFLRIGTSSFVIVGSSGGCGGGCCDEKKGTRPNPFHYNLGTSETGQPWPPLSQNDWTHSRHYYFTISQT